MHIYLIYKNLFYISIYIHIHIYVYIYKWIFYWKFKRWLNSKGEGMWLLWPIGYDQSDAVLIPEHSPQPMLPGSWATCSWNIPSTNPLPYVLKSPNHMGMPHLGTLVDSLEGPPMWISCLRYPILSNFPTTPAQMSPDCNHMRESKQQPHCWAESIHRTVRDNSKSWF